LSDFVLWTYSKYKGITFYKKQQNWGVQICVAGEKIFLGTFEDEIEAAMAYDEAAKKHYGEYAKLNFPDSTPRTKIWINRK